MIAIPFIYFTGLAIYLIRKNGGLNISAFVVLLYALSAFSSILLDHFNIYDTQGMCEKIPISPLATFCYCALITLAIIPFRHLNSTKIKHIDLQKEWMVDALSWILIITLFTTLLTTFININTILHSDLKEIRDIAYANETKVKLPFYQWILALPETLFSQFSPVAMLIYFANIVKKRKSTAFNYLLFVSSLTPVIKAVQIAGRTQPIYWLLSFVALYIFFRPFMSKEQRKIARFPFLLFSGIIGIFFLAVTLARFSSVGLSNDTGAFESIIVYSGQSFVNFNYFFCNYTAHDIHFDRIFPLTNYFIIHPGWNLTDYREIIRSYSGLNIGIFYTFLGDLMVDLDHAGMIIYVLIYFVISSYLCRTASKDGSMALSRFLIILVLYLIPLQGVFYYSYYKTNVGYFVVGTLIFCFLLSHSIKSKYNE